MPAPARVDVRAARRRRAGVRARILEAARELLLSRPWSELTIGDVMADAGQSRTIFYRYFEDRQGLLVALMEELGEEMARLGEDWLFGEGDPVTRLRHDLDRLVDLYVAHGPVLGAIAVAADEDDEVGAAYTAMAERFIDITAKRIRADVSQGASVVSNPEETARALVWLSERYLVKSFGTRGSAARPEDVQQTLHLIWRRTIYGADPPAARPARTSRRRP